MATATISLEPAGGGCGKVVSSSGEIVLVPVPFSDLSAAKVRPAICLANAGRGDWILFQITSNPFGDPLAVPLIASDFATGGLRVASVARPGKLFTASGPLIVRSVGRLNDQALQRILTAVVNLLRPGTITANP